jgi:4-hydroxybenzoate polyprenyltransferase
MQLFQICFLLFNIININSYKNFNINSKTNIRKTKAIFYKNQTTIINIDIIKPPNKIQSLLKLIRSNNIIPTTLLCFSGGWIMNPSITNLLHSQPFIVSILDTILILSASMALNDIYDLEIDKINSPSRPLVNGEIKIYEAFLLSLLLIGTSEYLTFTYLPDNLKFIIQLVIIQMIVYTPILKRILIIKNVSCASLVSFSLFFSGLAASNEIMSLHKNIGLLSVAMSLIFFGSWCNELLLDMRDKEGDKHNKIVTVPTLLGNDFSWVLSNIILYSNVVTNSLSIGYLYNNELAILVPIILSPLLFNLYKIKKENYSEKSIINYMKYSNYPLVVLLIYLCVIAKKFYTF